jgi:hypothetical protein
VKEKEKMKVKVKEMNSMKSENRTSRSLYFVKAAVAFVIFAVTAGYALVGLGAAPSALEAASNGAMKQYYKSDADRVAVIAWITSGAAKAQYDAVVAPILAKSCTVCHSPKGTVPTINLTTYPEVKKYTVPR